MIELNIDARGLCGIALNIDGYDIRSFTLVVVVENDPIVFMFLERLNYARSNRRFLFFPSLRFLPDVVDHAYLPAAALNAKQVQE